MSVGLHNLSPVPGSRKPSRRRGRGRGSGLGKTSGRGHKGQKSRSGASRPAWFEGGQMPLYRRTPKRGFRPISRVEYAVVNLSRLDGMGRDDADPASLAEAGLIGNARQRVKILGGGDISKAMNVKAHAFSGSARRKIEEAGGKAEVMA